MKIKIQKLHENAVTPTYAHAGDACFDLTACTVDGSSLIQSAIYRDKPVTCGTGLAFEVPEGHAMLVFSRSGMGFKRALRFANGTGIIDHGYAGEVMVRLTSDAPIETDDGYDAPADIIRPGERVAQAMIIRVDSIDFEVVEQLALSERGTGGFGSTGSAA